MSWFSFSHQPRYRPEQAAVFKDKDLKKKKKTLNATCSAPSSRQKLAGEHCEAFSSEEKHVSPEGWRRPKTEIKVEQFWGGCIKTTSVKSYNNYIIISWSLSAIRVNICAKVEEIPLMAFKISHSLEQDRWTDIPVTWCFQPQESSAQRQKLKKKRLGKIKNTFSIINSNMHYKQQPLHRHCAVTLCQLVHIMMLAAGYPCCLQPMSVQL